MGSFPIAMRQLKFLILGIDYFTKWVEAEALATITEKNIWSFVWRNINCKYGIPRVLVSDNGKQFDNYSFRDFCSQLGIKNHYSFPSHPQANGQVEITNWSLFKIIKTLLEGTKSIWPEEFPSVLWAYRTITKTLTGDMLSTSIRKRGSYPSWGRSHKLQGGQSWWKKERRGHASTAWPNGRSQGDNWTKTNTIRGPHGQALQLQSQTQRLQSWRPRLEEGDGCH